MRTSSKMRAWEYDKILVRQMVVETYLRVSAECREDAADDVEGKHERRAEGIEAPDGKELRI